MVHTDKRLVSLGLFWKNDKPGGFGLTTNEEQMGTAGMQELQVAIEAMLKAYHENDKPEYTEAYLRQIEGFASERQPGVPPDSHSIVVIAANLNFLASKGVIEVDNWTGVQYMYGS